MRDRHLWTEPKSLLRRVSPGRSGPAWGVGGEGTERKQASLGRDAGPGGEPRLPLAFPFFQSRLAGQALETPTLSPPGSGPPPASSWGLEKWRLELRALGPSCAPRGAGPGPSPEAFTAPRRPRLVQEARASQPPVPGPAPRGTAPRRLERGGGAGRVLGAWLSLRAEGTEGRGRPSGGWWPWWGPAVPGALGREQGCRRTACPPSVPLPPGYSPQVVQTELRARNCAGLRSGHVSKEGGACGRRPLAGADGARSPAGLLSGSRPPARGAVRASPELSRRPCSPPASGSLLSGRSALCAPLLGFSEPGSPSPGRERATAACGCCSNEKSEQLNRKIWIKKLEFNTHAPHLLKH